ncbi:MAG: aminopeptidase, partial [Deltaproteobacteria bacterium]|nr:aminopeptidase [Deltaproteobacteria bacterium]
GYHMPRIRSTIQLMGHVLLLCLLLLGSGCRLSYLFHVAKGQMELLNGAVPIEKALDTEPFTPDQRNKLLLVAQIKAFGEKDLGLEKTSNYETVYPHSGRNPIYMVSASKKDAFSLKTWWFPIVGDLPYLGFFDLKKAREECTRLAGENLDVYVGRAEAYSTLGWFQDPVTMNLIDGTTPRLVNTLLHEMTHATLYINGQGAFNEGLAVLVGKVGAIEFFEKAFGAKHPFTIKARDALADEQLFSRFLNTFMIEMEGVYNLQVGHEEKMRLKETVFATYHKRFDVLRKDFKTQEFVHFAIMPPNNAYLMTVALYHRHFNLFEAVLTKEGGSVKKMIGFLKGFSKKEGNLIERLQKAMNGRDASGYHKEGF